MHKPCLRFTSHAEQRLRERMLDAGIVESAVSRPEKIYYDIVTRRLVYAAWAPGGRRVLVVAEEEGGCLAVVTVIETSGLKVEERRVASGRWVCLHGC